MRASDATAFVEWANAVTGGDPVYRLPSRAELDDPEARRIVAAASLPELVTPWDASGTSVHGPLPDLAFATALRADITAFIGPGNRDRVRDLARDLDLDRLLGSSLTGAVEAVESEKRGRNDWDETFASALVAGTWIDAGGALPVVPEALADLLDQATEKLRAVLPSQDSYGYRTVGLPRELLAGNKLRDYAAPVLERGASSDRGDHAGG